MRRGVERGEGGGGCLAAGLTSVTTAWLAPHIFSNQYVTKEEMEGEGGLRGGWEAEECRTEDDFRGGREKDRVMERERKREGERGRKRQRETTWLCV